MDTGSVLLRKRGAVLVEGATKVVHDKSVAVVAALQASCLSLGFVLDKKTVGAVSKLSPKDAESLHSRLIEELKDMTGAKKSWKPFYPNFPQQVIDASEIELLVNAIFHYWTGGDWKPAYEVLPRLAEFEPSQARALTLGTKRGLWKVYSELLGSNAALGQYDTQVLEWFLDEFDTKDLIFHTPERIPFKENLCKFCGTMLEKGKDKVARKPIKTATDVLRILAYLSGGDVSLAENTKFKSLPRRQRRFFLSVINEVGREEDFATYQETWKRAFHMLKPGDNAHATPQAYKFSNMVARNGAKSWESKFEYTFGERNMVQTLSDKPGMFARKLDHVLRAYPRRKKKVLEAFFAVSDKVDTRVLLQLLGYYRSRVEDRPYRVFVPKSSKVGAVFAKNDLDKVSQALADEISEGVRKTLLKRFSKLGGLGNVWVDPVLAKCPVPSAQRGASVSLKTLARGTRIPITSDTKVVRFFQWWQDTVDEIVDVDLSCQFYNDKLSPTHTTSFYHLRSDGGATVHSGDVINAPRPGGACEFIDVDLEKARKLGRYVIMTSRTYTGQTFNKLDGCFIGWMERTKPQSNEVFDPKTVVQRVDMCSVSRTCYSVAFDLETREAIWLDMQAKAPKALFNTVHGTKGQSDAMVYEAVHMVNKASLFELFSLHAKARGKAVKDRKKADTVFSLDEGITPYDIGKINSEYVV